MAPPDPPPPTPTEGPPTTSTLRDLMALVRRLRAPDGCPWDREQTLADVRAFLIEEAHEVAATLDEGAWSAIGPELGDLLFQIAFVLELAAEQDGPSPEQVIADTHAKMVERHPHVFGDTALADADEVRRAWEARKLGQEGVESLLAGVPTSLPALVGAYRMSQKASAVGFDWPDPESVLEKIDEELDEVRAELARGPDLDPARLQDEIGDLLFTIANLARARGIDPEAALAGTNRKFRRRFRHVEDRLQASGRHLAGTPIEELELLWQEAKRTES